MVTITEPKDEETLKLNLPETITISWSGELGQNNQWNLYINDELRYEGRSNGTNITFRNEGRHTIKVMEVPEGIE